ncbi:MULTISPECIES: SsrA-binding protein [Muriicola]|uniref:SsrA-binding protein n=1 Tax=Muriicola TaxID=762641 RepID=UPI00166D2070|nr:SsrA-binding protein [Muriicola marianensis]
MKKLLFNGLAALNRLCLPSYSKRQLDLSKASKLQLAIIGWRYYVTTRALDQ